MIAGWLNMQLLIQIADIKVVREFSVVWRVGIPDQHIVQRSTVYTL